MSRSGNEEHKLNKKVSLRIKELREKREPVQSKFAKDHFIDRQLLSRWENTNDDRGISIHTILKFCKMINITLQEFFDDKTFNN